MKRGIAVIEHFQVATRHSRPNRWVVQDIAWLLLLLVRPVLERAN